MRKGGFHRFSTAVSRPFQHPRAIGVALACVAGGARARGRPPRRAAVRPGVAARTAYMKAVDAEELELAKEILALLPKQ